MGTSALSPLLVQGDALFPNDFHRSKKLGDLEPGREYDDIKVVLLACAADDAILSDFFDTFSDELDVWIVE